MPALQIDGKAIATVNKHFVEMFEHLLKPCPSGQGAVVSCTPHSGKPIQTQEPSPAEGFERFVTRQKWTVTIEIEVNVEAAKMVPIVKGRGS